MRVRCGPLRSGPQRPQALTDGESSPSRTSDSEGFRRVRGLEQLAMEQHLQRRQIVRSRWPRRTLAAAALIALSVGVPSTVIGQNSGGTAPDAVGELNAVGSLPAQAAHRVVAALRSVADPWIDTSDRAGVVSAYRAEFERTEPDTGFTGDVDACVAGTTSQAFRDSELQRINWYRRMAGLDVVTENVSYSADAQHAALMMAAAGDTTHEPNASWPCYSAQGARGAGKSSLALTTGVDAIDMYMHDEGNSNTPVGHRRWILSPYVHALGMGDAFAVQASGGRPQQSRDANALFVVGDLEDSADRLREVRRFVAWPPPGYVPAATVWRRWSFAPLGSVDFSAASVTVTHDAGAVPVEIVNRNGGTGYGGVGSRALVWEVTDLVSWDHMADPTGGDKCYTVTVSDVRVDGHGQQPYEYETCVLDLSAELPPPSVPVAPKNLEATTVGHDSVTLSWTLVAQQEGVTVNRYIVERLDGANWIELKVSSTALTNHTVFGLQPLTEYRFRARLDTTGGDASAAVTVTIDAAPIEPVAVADPGAESSEVRIVARQVAGGRVEFALQQHEADGDWGARLLPRQRFFPLGTSEGRWLVSTPLSLSGSVVQARIVARRVAGGRVEFALQQREPNGDWEPRLLPQRRLFPVATAAGRWLASSPLTLLVHATELPPPIDDDIDTPSDPPSDLPSDPPSDPPSDLPPPPTTQPRINPVEELASLVLVGANGVRGRSAPLRLDDRLSAAARARAEAMAVSDDWQADFDYDVWLASGWGVWFAGGSAWIDSEFDDVRVARSLSGALLDEASQRVLGCELCTHLGVGVATHRGRTYATVVVAGPAPTGDVIAAAEAQMAGLVNRLRAGLGLDPLTYHNAIAAVARRWSQTLVAEGAFYHNPHYSEQYPPGWQLGAENVSGPSGIASLSVAVQRSFDGLVDSPGHYANMTNPRLTHLGVGIAVRGNRVLVTQNFARYPTATQTTQSGPPGAATVTATGGANQFSARWSADANGAAITRWEFLGSVTATFDDAVTSYTWTSVVAGRYTIQVRACNDDGCGDWGSATVTVTDPAPGTRRVEVSRGANAQNVDPNCTSANCHYVRVTLVNFEPGTYTVRCRHDGVASYPAGQYGWYTTSATTSEYCIWGFAGHDTYVIVEDPQTGEPVRSNNAQWP